MIREKTAVAATLLALAGVLAACGSSSSSSSATGGGGTADAPTDASQSAFCKTFTQLGQDVAPREAADRLVAVGTPSGIDDSARNGFEILVSHLHDLPDDSERADLESMARDLPGSDQSDVIAFVTYYANECQTVPSM
jgi:ABC-type Fe3+-hydroxamate transport system substrate-binding protein